MDRITIITGANNGIGLAMTQSLLGMGGYVGIIRQSAFPNCHGKVSLQHGKTGKK